ncbi:MAG: (2Fe-2S)-binding protein, partial [Gaiellales bacterium]
MSDLHDIALTINGRVHRESVESRVHLADFLRHTIGLTGTHVGCEQGVCGNCTVQLDGVAVKSCLVLAAQADGREIRTIEGLADGQELSELQTLFSVEHGLQCGYCTPGFLMTVGALAESAPASMTRDQVREELAGVLCRCTGYEGAVRATVR